MDVSNICGGVHGGAGGSVSGQTHEQEAGVQIEVPQLRTTDAHPH